ncbi:MAG: hypothetical protein HC782_01380 [Gammaproteobacteria bacterium]|nr:hypothetical protein [Gammaproteobacteria bacterium]
MEETELIKTAAIATIAALVAVLVTVLPKIKRRLALSKAKHPSLTGHSRMAKRVARMLPGYHYDEAHFFNSDDAPVDVILRRRQALMRLSQLYAARYPKSLAMTKDAAIRISDLQFTSAYRVPYQYSVYLSEHLKSGSFIAKSNGVTFTDMDGNIFFDLTGSYGVNVFGVDFYKSCIAEGSKRAEQIGPVLGTYHPCVKSNVEKTLRPSPAWMKCLSTCQALRPSCKRCG